MSRTEARLERRAEKLEIVSENLRFLRKHYFPGRGGSKKCADALNMKQQQWSPWEKGQRIPVDESLRKCADLFGVTMKQLLVRHEDPQKALIDNRTKTPTAILSGASDVEAPGKAPEPAMISASHDTSPQDQSQNIQNSLGFNTSGIVREIVEDVRRQLIDRLNNVEATFKFKLSIVDVDVRL